MGLHTKGPCFISISLVQGYRVKIKKKSTQTSFYIHLLLHSILMNTIIRYNYYHTLCEMLMFIILLLYYINNFFQDQDIFYFSSSIPLLISYYAICEHFSLFLEEMKESYKRVVCLHSLCGARDILLNCCLESAISHLQAADEKYPSCLTGTFYLIRV